MCRYLLAFLLVVLSVDVFAACTRTSAYFANNECLSIIPALSRNPNHPIQYCRALSGYPNEHELMTCSSLSDCPVGVVCVNRAGDKTCAPDHYYDANTDQCISGEEPDSCEEKEGEVQYISVPFGITPSCVDGCSVSSSPIINDIPTFRIVYTGSSCSSADPSETVNEPDIIDESDPVENSECTPNSPDYSGTGLNGEYYCNADSVCTPPAVPFYFPDGSFTCLSLEPCPNPDMIRVDGNCQYPPNYTTEEQTVAVVIGQDGTKTTTTTTTTSTTNTSGQTTTNTETTVTQETLTDPNDPLQGYNPPIIIESESESIEGNQGAVLGGIGCGDNDQPRCIDIDAGVCAILQQQWLMRCRQILVDDDTFDYDGFDSGVMTGTQSDLDSIKDQIDGIIDDMRDDGFPVDNVFDIGDIAGTADFVSQPGTCPPDIPIALFGNEVLIPVSSLCTLLGYIAFLIRLSAAILAFRLTFDTIKGL